MSKPKADHAVIRKALQDARVPDPEAHVPAVAKAVAKGVSVGTILALISKFGPVVLSILGELFPDTPAA